jgi:cyclopropane fatty-acyl-phospholipid synthase-like methyltransferase
VKATVATVGDPTHRVGIRQDPGMQWKAFWNDSAQVTDGDPCRQVGRTFQRAAFSESDIQHAVDRILSFLDASTDKTLLDLACGNGLITSRLAPHFKAITAVDFSKPLIDTAMRHFAPSNVEYVNEDVLDFDTARGPYDRVLVSAALQHFGPANGRRLFGQLKRLVKPGGRVVLADVADGDRVWNFYRGVGGRLRYALGIVRRRPIIGYWWKASALRHLADELGWTLSIECQTPDLPNHYFRYDAVIDVPAGSPPAASGRLALSGNQPI